MSRTINPISHRPKPLEWKNDGHYLRANDIYGKEAYIIILRYGITEEEISDKKQRAQEYSDKHVWDALMEVAYDQAN